MINSSVELHRMALQWVDSCAVLLSSDDWNHVCRALGEMHDQLREDLADDDELDTLFADLVAGLVDRLGNHRVTSLPQAQIYQCSADDAHRTWATAWMEQNRH